MFVGLLKGNGFRSSMDGNGYWHDMFLSSSYGRASNIGDYLHAYDSMNDARVWIGEMFPVLQSE